MKKSRTGRKPRMTLERFAAIILQEIADVRWELKQDIQGLKVDIGTLQKDTTAMKADIKMLKTDMHTVKGDLSTLRLEVHQNQLMFMGYMDRTDKRLDKLEATAA